MSFPFTDLVKYKYITTKSIHNQTFPQITLKSLKCCQVFELLLSSSLPTWHGNQAFPGAEIKVIDPDMHPYVGQSSTGHLQRSNFF